MSSSDSAEQLAASAQSLSLTAASSSPASDAATTSTISSTSSSNRILNINVGILGHVDSGKTSLAKALSEVLSTAALDKLPQSQARGITLDLGFSAMFIPVPAHLQHKYDAIQITLVDCPGHASLIRTILGGAAIIDLMLLVLDAQKGLQTQSAECLVIGEILCERMMVVINKVDLLTEKEKQLAKLEKNLRQLFAGTKFGKDIPIVHVSANPGSSDDLKTKDAAASTTAAVGGAPQPPDVTELVKTLSSHLIEPVRSSTDPNSSAPFLFAVDHCFQIKGQGTVLTGTVLSGRVTLNMMVEIPSLKQERKVKSMQMFKKPVDSAVQGDRLGICVTQLDSKLIERGLLCTPGSVQTYDSIIAVVDKVRFYKGQCLNKTKFHVSIGHSTAMATVHFFGGPPPKPTQSTQPAPSSGSKSNKKNAKSNNDANSTAASSSSSSAPVSSSSSSSSASSSSSSSSSSKSPPAIVGIPPIMNFDWSRDYAWRDELLPVGGDVEPYTQYAVLEFEKPVQCPVHSVLIGSRLDTDIHLNTCRLAFQGRFLTGMDWQSADAREKLRVYKLKERTGLIDRVVDERTVIGRDLFSKGTEMSQFIGKKVELETGEKGVIEGAFGQGGKFKAYFQGGLPIPAGSFPAGASAAAIEDDEAPAAAGKKGKNKAPKVNLKGKIFLRFKKYMFAQEKKNMVQD